MLCAAQVKSSKVLTKAIKETEKTDLHKHLGTTFTLRGGAVHRHGLPVTGELQSEVLLHELLDHLLENTEIRGFVAETQSSLATYWNELKLYTVVL